MPNTNTIRVNGQEQEVSLAELAELDITGVEASFGGFAIAPPSTSLWKVNSMALETMGEYTVVQAVLEVEKCYAILDKTGEYDTESYIGQTFNLNFFLKELPKDVGQVVGFLQKIGMQTGGKLDALFDQAVGQSFVGKVTHSKNKDDPDKPYQNMDIKAIMSEAEFVALQT